MSRRSSAWLFGLCALIVGLRLLVVWLGSEGLRDDPDAYARLASVWARTGVFGLEGEAAEPPRPTAYRPPLYPWLLSWLAYGEGQVPIFSVAGLHLCLGLGTIWATWSVARRLQLGWPALSAVLITVDPLLLRASQLVMTETLAACLAMFAWRMWLGVYPSVAGCLVAPASSGCGCDGPGKVRSLRQWLSLLGLGLLCGLSVLARPTAGPGVAGIAVGILCCSSACWKRRLNDTLIFSGLVAACVAPWMLRNWAELGQPLWATTHGGYTLLLANNPQLYSHFEKHGPSRAWDATEFHRRWSLRDAPGLTVGPEQAEYWNVALDLDPSSWSSQHDNSGQGDSVVGELADDRRAYEAAWATIERQPALFAWSSVYRVGWLWALWPHTDSRLARWGIGLWYGSLFLAACWGLARQLQRLGWHVWLRQWWLPLSLGVSLTLVHAVYWSNMRMRAPVMGMVCVAVGGLRSRDP